MLRIRLMHSISICHKTGMHMQPPENRILLKARYSSHFIVAILLSINWPL